jgi:hypothetical protein
MNDIKPTVMTDGRKIVISILFTPGPLVDGNGTHVASLCLIIWMKTRHFMVEHGEALRKCGRVMQA